MNPGTVNIWTSCWKLVGSEEIWKKDILFEAEILEANEGISYCVFECFSNFQIAKKVSKLKNISSMKIKSKLFGWWKFPGRDFPQCSWFQLKKFVRFLNISSHFVSWFRNPLRWGSRVDVRTVEVAYEQVGRSYGVRRRFKSVSDIGETVDTSQGCTICIWENRFSWFRNLPKEGFRAGSTFLPLPLAELRSRGFEQNQQSSVKYWKKRKFERCATKNIVLLLDHRKKQFPGSVVGGLGVATFSHEISCLAPVIMAYYNIPAEALP